MEFKKSSLSIIVASLLLCSSAAFADTISLNSTSQPNSVTSLMAHNVDVYQSYLGTDLAKKFNKALQKSRLYPSGTNNAEALGYISNILLKLNSAKLNKRNLAAIKKYAREAIAGNNTFFLQNLTFNLNEAVQHAVPTSVQSTSKSKTSEQTINTVISQSLQRSTKPPFISAWLSGNIKKEFTKAFIKNSQPNSNITELAVLMQNLASPYTQFAKTLNKTQKQHMRTLFNGFAHDILHPKNKKISAEIVTNYLDNLNNFVNGIFKTNSSPANVIAGIKDIMNNNAAPFKTLLGNTAGSNLAKLYYQSVPGSLSKSEHLEITQYGSALLNLYHYPGFDKLSTQQRTELRTDLSNFNKQLFAKSTSATARTNALSNIVNTIVLAPQNGDSASTLQQGLTSVLKSNTDNLIHNRTVLNTSIYNNLPSAPYQSAQTRTAPQTTALPGEENTTI